MCGMARYDDYCVKPGDKVDLAKIKTDDDGGLSKKDAEEKFESLRQKLIDLHELMYAQGKLALLVVFQAMDTGGKDSTIRAIFSGVNPQGCIVTNFKAPSTLERSHDFLWRIHRAVPKRGDIGIFNRSHYEDVLIVRVKKLVEEKRWKARYEQINQFEELLHDEGVIVRKFYLHISKDYQKERLQKRLDNPKKHWKFDPADLVERARWDDYQKAYEDALSKCSTKHAPWYVIPAQTRWYRDLLVAQVLVDTLESLEMKYPTPTFDPSQIKIE